MATNSPATKQLDLWSQEEPRTLTIGDVFECTQSWADGDTSPSALQQLASILRGKLEVSDWRIKPAFFYRILGTRVEDDKVIATCRIVPSPLGTSSSAADDEEEY